MQVEVHTDGCSKKQNTMAACAFVIARYYENALRHYDIVGNTGWALDTGSFYLGPGTSNYAELYGVKIGLNWLVDHQLKNEKVVLKSDSKYAIDLMNGKSQPKVNKELVAELRSIAAGFPFLTFEWEKGHVGNPFNELADGLATVRVLHHIAEKSV